jgi:hypothetical protein
MKYFKPLFHCSVHLGLQRAEKHSQQLELSFINSFNMPCSNESHIVHQCIRKAISNLYRLFKFNILLQTTLIMTGYTNDKNFMKQMSNAEYDVLRTQQWSSGSTQDGVTYLFFDKMNYY